MFASLGPCVCTLPSPILCVPCVHHCAHMPPFSHRRFFSTAAFCPGMPPAKTPAYSTGWPANCTNLLANSACRQACAPGYSGSLVTRCFSNATWAPGFRGNCTRGEAPRQYGCSRTCLIVGVLALMAYLCLAASAMPPGRQASGATALAVGQQALLLSFSNCHLPAVDEVACTTCDSQLP